MGSGLQWTPHVSPWHLISQQMLSTIASFLELSTSNCAFCHLGPGCHLLQVQWLAHLPPGLFHMLYSVRGALSGDHLLLSLFQSCVLSEGIF